MDRLLHLPDDCIQDLIERVDTKGAYSFYRKFILDYAVAKMKPYEEHGFTDVEISPRDWEVFGAILMRDKGTPGYGTDLEKHEVKSALSNGSYEYQYHKDHGLDKLEEDRHVDHVFIERSKDYRNIHVRWLQGRSLWSYFDKWLPVLEKHYGSGRNQRFRRSIGFSFVKKHGIVIMQIIDGQLVGEKVPS